jgi:hypothetical protein
VPDEAKKPIKGGRLNGMTDINPMYRIKRLTEIFGPCGLGWWYTIRDERIVDDELTGQRAAFVDIDLYYKDPATGEESHAIPGTGGASFVAKERNGLYLSDECFKMALTDAISVAAKALGVAEDVYWAKDRTKYSAAPAPGGEPPRTGSTEAARAVGEAKLEQMNAQAATNGPATDTQKQWITDNASAGDYMNIMQKYGPNLERMSAKAALRVIEQIKVNNAAGESA